MFTHRVGSIGTSSIRRVFIRGTNINLWKVPNIASGNTVTDIFQEKSAGFKSAVYLNNKKYFKVISPVHS
jgi:hypothetical protein